MRKITYEDKQAIQNDDNIANKNKVTADDMNEIKKVVNENAEEIKEEAAEIKAENVRLRSDINSIALIGEMEGESIDLDDSSDARFLEFRFGGNHKQEVREGYNLLDVNNNISSSGELTYANGVFTSNTITSQSVKNVLLSLKNAITVDTTQNYYISFEARIKSGTGDFSNNINDGTYNYTIIQKPTLSVDFQKYIVSHKYTENQEKSIKQILFQIKENSDNLVIEIQNIMFSTKYEPYEQYGASPSIDYLSEVETVGNNVQLLDESKASVKTVNGMTLSYSKEQGLILNGTTTAQTNFWLLNLGEELEAGNYTLSSNVNLENKGVYALKASNSNLVQSNLKEAVTFETSKVTATELLIQINAGVTFNNQILKIKLEKGKKATPWSPYGQGCAEIKLENNNIMPILTANGWEYTTNGIKNLNRNEGVEVTRFNVKKGQTIKIGLKMISRPTEDTSYSLYFKDTNTVIGAFAHISDSSVIELNKIYERSYIAEEDGDIFIKLWGNENADIFEFQLWAEKNSLTEYKQYQSQTAIMPIQQEMLKGDYFDFDREKEVHIWKKLVLTGNENWITSSLNVSGYKSFYCENLLKNAPKNNVEKICTHFKSGTIEEWGQLRQDDFIENNNWILGIRISDSIVSDLNTFKKLIKDKYDSGDPVTIYYKTDTQTELNFTDEQKVVAKQIKETLHTYKNVTHISSDDEVSPIFNVKYAKDPNVKNDNLQKQIDEIKQLLSTTQTSALLLDNLQKDVESEVE